MIYNSRKFRVLAAWLMVASLLMPFVGCVHFPATRHKDPVPLPESIKAKFYRGPSYAEVVLVDFEKSAKNIAWEEKNDCTVTRYSMTRVNVVMSDGNKIIFDVFRSNDCKVTAVILSLPILGGDNEVAEIWARYLASRGYTVIIVHRQEGYKDFEDITELNSALTQIVYDHVEVINWIESQDDLDSNRIGVVGISFGGIKALLVAAHDDRIKAVFAGLVGANLPYILMNSHQGAIKGRIAKMQQDLCLTDDEFLAGLQQELGGIDLLELAKHIDPEIAFLLNGFWDTVIPREAFQDLLGAFTSKPERMHLFSGHLSAFLYVEFIRQVILDFLNKKLEYQGGPEEVN